MENLRQDGKDDEAYYQDGAVMRVDPFADAKHLQQVGAFHAADQQEIEDAGHADSPEKGDAVAQVLLIVEGEDHAGYPHNYQTENEGYGHGEEDGDDDLQRLVGIDEVLIAGTGRQYLRHSQRRTTTQQAEDHRYRGGGGHTQRVEDIKQDNVGGGYGEEDAHDVVERIACRRKDTMTCDIHHAAAR